jgi:hypothetical protein
LKSDELVEPVQRQGLHGTVFIDSF